MDYKKSPKEWDNLDLNQVLTGYEGGRFPLHPALSNHYEHEYKKTCLLDATGFCEFKMAKNAPRCTVVAPLRKLCW